MSSEVRALLNDLTAAAVRAPVDAHKALQVEAFRMKDDWRRRVSGARGLGGLPASITYEVTLTGPTTVAAEVGYDKSGQGELGNIAEHGTSTQGPKRPAGKVVLEAGVDRLVRYLSQVDPL